ncbi:hypothetical protein D3C76_1586100 [compost metagenome]
MLQQGQALAKIIEQRRKVMAIDPVRARAPRPVDPQQIINAFQRRHVLIIRRQQGDVPVNGAECF